MVKETYLHDKHVALGAKMVDFAGWHMPVQYSSIIEEHKTVRNAVGLFDVSHMGEVFVSGKEATTFLNKVVPQDIEKLGYEKAVYCQLPNKNGGLIDDLIIYKLGIEYYLVICNASRIDEDLNWVVRNKRVMNVNIDNQSHNYSLLAIQGPKAIDLVRKMGYNIPDQKSFTIKPAIIEGIKLLASRTGYTGEDGFELYLAAEEAPKLWEILMETGKEEGLIPCGLGARDTLRLEAAMPLYGHEMDDTVTPLEAGLGIFVKMKKDEFIGKAAIEEKGALTRKRVGLKVTGRGIIREHEKVYCGDKEIGHTTSGTHCPYLGYPIAMALLDVDYAEIGTKVEADVRGRRIEAEVVALPFYKKGQPQ